MRRSWSVSEFVRDVGARALSFSRVFPSPVLPFRRRTRAVATPPCRRKVLFEMLEQRLLLSGDPLASVQNGVLSAELTDGADTLVVRQVEQSLAGGVILDLTVGGVTSRFGTHAAGIDRIEVRGGKGDDSFRFVDITVDVDVRGDDGSDRLVGDQGGTWTMDGLNRGSVGNVTFRGVENLQGADDSTDTFVFTAAGGLDGQVLGGSDGEDTLQGPGVASSWVITGENAGTLNGAIVFSGIENIAGGAGIDTLVGSDEDNTWSLSGFGAGSLNGVTSFSGIENLTGGRGNDAFLLPDAGWLAGLVDGGLLDPDAPSVNSLDFSARTTAVEVDLESSTATSVSGGFARINRVVGGIAEDTLTGPVALLDQTAWSVTGIDAGTVDGTAFAGFENLSGQDSSSDAFVFATLGGVTGTISGGTGSLDGFAVAVGTGSLLAFQPAGADAADTTTVSGKTIHYAGMDRYSPFSGDDANRVITGTLFDRNMVVADVNPFTTGAMRVSFTGLSFTDGSTFTFATPTVSLTLATGTGGDAIVVSSLDAGFSASRLQYAAGVLSGQLRATDDDATIALGSTEASVDGGLIITLTVNGHAQTFGTLGAGVQRITLDGRGGADTFTLDEVLPLLIDIAGGGGADTLVGPEAGMQWEVTGADSGSGAGISSFASIENLLGRGGEDRFNVRSGGSISGLVDGGGGLDMLVGPDVDSTWSLSGADAGTLNGSTDFTGIENLTGGFAADTFQVGAAGSLSGVLDGGLAKAVVEGGPAATDTLDYSLFGSAASVDLAAQAGTAIQAFSRINLFKGSSAADTLTGPGEAGDQVTWTVNGANAGVVKLNDDPDGVGFIGFENLSGQDASNDTFLFGRFGSLGGLLSGGTGAGTTDGFKVADATVTQGFQPTTDNQAGTITLLGRTIAYAGMDKYTVLTGSAVDRKILGSIFDDDIVLEADTPGRMKVTFNGHTFTSDGINFSGTFFFDRPSKSLTIEGGGGGDTITVKSLDANFAADLLLYGNKSGAPALEPDINADVVRFEGDVYTKGGYLEVFADKIYVNAGKTLSTLTDQADLSTGNDIVFRARRIGTTEIENLLPSGYLSKSVEIDVGANATIRASGIYLVTQAEDRALADTLGLTTLESQRFLDPAVSFLQDLVALPVKVLVKASEAKVTIHEGARLQADDVVGIYATAASDASAQAKSQLFSIGYSQADATATIDIQDHVLIEGGGAINITSDASATASMSTETSREEQGSVPGKKSAGFAGSLAVSWARLTSTTTVAATAEVHGGRTVNIRALGETESEAEAESGLYADGTAALAIALQFSTADILSQVAGKVTADMNTVGGEVVKFEFDPTVAAAGMKSNQVSTRLVAGDTVQVLTEVPVSATDDPRWSDLLMPANTVFRYIGPDINGAVNLATQNYRDPTKWVVTSEPWGYVDTVNNRISVHNAENEANNWVVVTEDTADYSPRRGNSIGGLDRGQTYVIIALEDDPLTAVDESHYVKLARTEGQAIAGQAIDLTNEVLAPTSTLTRTFTAADVQDDKITLNGIGNTFELGQAVIYREVGHDANDTLYDSENPDGTPELGADGKQVKRWRDPDGVIDKMIYTPKIVGLEHGSQYYVMTGVDQFNLIGDQRLVNKQVLQLGALENETRGGIARVKLGTVDPNSSFTLSATHILDSTFLTFGIGSALNATDTVSATAGFSKENVDDPDDDDDGGFDWGSSVFDNIFNKASEKYSQNKGAGGANGKASLQVAGALAFSYTDHDVKTLIKGTADLNSNDDMELTSGITEKLTISAESTGEEQPGKKDDKGKAAANTSADNSISAAIAVGVVNNASRAIIESGAHLDSMRALRLLSGVTYPFLTRPDEFVPTSVGELTDSLTSEGFDFLNSYLDGTGGLKSLFNTWTRSTTSSDKMAIAGSINVLSFTNVAESIVHAEAIINQDPFYRPDPRFYLKEGDPGYDPDYAPDAGDEHGNDNITHSANANNVDEHVVSIEATNYMQFMNVTGVFGFHLPSVELSEPVTFAANGIDDADMSFDAKLTPTRGGKGGVGGAIFLEFLDNTTHAVVESGVKLYSGKQSGLNIKAEEAIMGFAFSQAGADAGKVAVGGTFSYYQQESDTLAHLQAGSEITGGRVDVYAGSLDTQINWAGGVAKSEAIGAGISVAINNMDRKTRAVIGELEDTAGTGITGDSTIDVVGTVTARASVAGGLYAFTVAGALANAKEKDEPDNSAGPEDDDPLDGVSLPRLFDEDPPSEEAQQKKAGTGVAIAAAVAINLITDVTQASLSDAIVTADAVDIKANNRNDIISATGGLAFARTDAGGKAASLAGAFSYNEIAATTNAFVRDSNITLRSVAFDDDGFVVETATQRFSLTADNLSHVWTLAAGGAGAVASGGTATTGNTFTLSLAGSVSLNTLTGSTRASLIDSTLNLGAGLAASDVRVRATDDSDILAIAGSLSLSIASGAQGGATALSAGAAIAVNKIVSDTDALVQQSVIDWAGAASGGLTVEATSRGSIRAYTVAGALAAAVAKQQGSGVAGSGAGSGSVNQVDADTTATLRHSTVDAGGPVTVHADNTTQITAAAGAIAVSFARAGTGTAAAVAIGASFAINNLDGDGDGNLVWADVDHSTVTARGGITVEAEMLAGIFSLGIGAAGSLASSQGAGVAVAAAGSVGVNNIRNSTQARVRNGSTLTTAAGSGGAISVRADDNSWIDATAGAAAISIALTQKTAVAPALGISLTFNAIENTTRAAVEDSDLRSNGTITVSAESDARIDSLAFGIAVGMAISGNASAISVGATGALGFNEIDNLVEATVRNSAPGGAATVVSDGAFSVTARDDSISHAIAVAASLGISGTTNATSVSVAVGLALAHNRLDKDVTASIANLSSVLTNGGDIVVSASDGSEIEVSSFAAGVSVSVGSGTSVGVAGGASESTNVILSRTNAYVQNSALGSAAQKVGKVDLDADSSSTIDANVGAVAAALSFGKTAVGVAIGIGVARNFIGWDPAGAVVTGTVLDNDRTVASLSAGTKVRIVEGALAGEVYEYIGPTVSDGDTVADGAQPVDLRIQQYRDVTSWKHVSAGANAAQVRAYLLDTSVQATGAVTVDARSTQDIDALVVAGAIGISGGATTGIAVSGAGVYSENKVKTQVKAYIDGDGNAGATDGIRAASIHVQADDASGIHAIAAAGSIAAGFGSTAGVAVSLGLSLAFNEVANEVESFIRNADEGVTTSSGDISLSSSARGRPLFDLALAGLSFTVAELHDASEQAIDDPSTGPDESGLDTAGDDVIEAKVRAAFAVRGETMRGDLRIAELVEGQRWVLNTEGASYLVERVGALLKVSKATIDAVSVAASVALGFGSTAGVAFAGAGAVASNVVLSKANAFVQASDLDSAGNVVLDASSTSGIVATVVAASAAVGGGGTAGVGASIGVAISHNYIGYQADGTPSPAEVRAYVLDSSVEADGDLVLRAVADQEIDAVVIAGSVAVGAGGTAGIGASGTGVEAANRINVTVEASITGDGTDGIRADSITLTAQDTSSISSLAGAASLAAAFSGTVGVALSIGVSLAHNTIASTVEAFIANADDGVTSTVGDITLSATEDATIDSVSFAAALSVGISGTVGAGVAGAGAEATNVILTTTSAYVRASVLSSAGDLGVEASNTSSIDATIVAAAVSVGVGGTVGIGASIGAALATNLVGFTEAGPRQAAVVQAFLENTSVLDADDLDISAISDLSVHAIVLAGSVAIAGGTVGVGLAGAGASSKNRIGADVKAYIAGDGALGITAGSLTVEAEDSSFISADTGAAAVAASFGVAGASVSVGVAIAENEIDNAVDAYISGASDLSTTSGGISVTADETATIRSLTAAASVAVSITIGGSVAAAVTMATNTLTSSVTASIADSGDVQSAGGVTVAAEDTSSVSAEVLSVALSVGLISLAAGVVTVDNAIGNDVTAFLEDSNVTAGGAGDISVTASSHPTITSTATVGAVSFGLGIAGAGGVSKTTIDGDTEAYVDGGTLTALGDDVTVTADSTSTATPLIQGLSAGLAAVSVMSADATIAGQTRAWAGGATTVAASKLDLAATDLTSATPVSRIAGGGVFSIEVTNSVLDVSRDTVAEVVTGADIDIGAGELSLLASSHSSGNSSASSATGSAIRVGLLTVDSTVEGETRAAIQSGATVRAAGGAVSVTALGDNAADATVNSFGVGILLTVGVSKPTAEVTATTEAAARGNIIGSMPGQRAGNVTVLAQANDRATAGAITDGGGAVSVDTQNVEASAASTVTAAGGGTILSGGSISIQAFGRTDADASSKSTSGGVVAVTSMTASASADPTVNASIDAGAILEAGQGVTVTAVHGEDPPVYSDGSFDAVADVEPGPNTIRFANNHGLLTGDTVVYDRAGNTAVGGLTTGRTYGVIVSNATTLQLGGTFSSFAGNGTTPRIDLDRDTITFAGVHNLQDGDRVLYAAEPGSAVVGGLVSGQAYLVKRVDAYSIKLAAPAGYAAPKAFSGASIAADVITLAGHGFTDGQAVTYRAPPAASFATGRVDDATDTIGLAPGHGFVTGDEVVYRSNGAVIGGLVDGGRYFVIVTASGIQLAASHDEATGVPADPSATPPVDEIPVTPIALTPSAATAAQDDLHSLRKVANQAIGGLVDGQTYYVDLVTGQPTKFRLLDGAGQVVALNPLDPVTGAVLTGNSTLGTESVDLTNAGSGNHRLVIDILADGTGTQRFDGIGGARALAGAPSGDGVVTSSASGSSGGVVRVTNSNVDASTTPTVNVTVGAGARIVAQDITIGGTAKANVTATSANSGGGLVSVGNAQAAITVDADSAVSIGAGAVLQASNDLLVTSFTDINAGVLAQSDGGGLVDFADADVTATITYSATLDVLAGAQLAADDDLTLDARSALDAHATSIADSAGLGSSAGTVADLDVGTASERALTRTSLGAGARLEGGTVLVRARASDLEAHASAEADSGGAVADASAKGLVDVFDRVELALASGASVLGDVVTLAASHSGVDIKSRGDADTDGLYADAAATARSNYDSENVVTTASGASVAARELFVNAAQSIDRYERSLFTGVDVFGNKNPTVEGDFNARRSIEWNGDVILLAQKAPRLLVDANGLVVEAVDITVDGHGQGYVVAGNTIVVDDIVNGSDAGQATFTVNDVVSAPAGVMSGSGGTVYTSTTFDKVSITNLSDKHLVLNDINVANPAARGSVTLAAQQVSLRFDVGNTGTAADIAVLNDGDGDVWLNGLIDNAVGRTAIDNTGGAIVNASPAGSIRTNALSLSAGGAIGASTSRLAVDLVRSVGRETALTADAGGSAWLELEGHLRATLPGDPTFNADRVSAGGDVDIRLLATVQDEEPTGTQGALRVTENGVIDFFFNHFKPDATVHNDVTNADEVVKRPLDRSLYSTGGSTTLDSAWDFRDGAANSLAGLIAGGNITIAAAAPAADQPILHIRANTDLLGTGHVDAASNGDITLDELAGDLRIGTIRSNAGDVALAAAGSLYDVAGGNVDTAWVTGNSVSVSARGGAIGSPANALEIDSSSQADGLVDGLAHDSVFLRETLGDLRLGGIASQYGDMQLLTLAGSMLDGAADMEADLQARNIDLLAIGGGVGTADESVEVYGAGVGQEQNTLELNEAVPGVGRLFVDAEGDVNLTEAYGALNVLKVTSDAGSIRLASYDTVLAGEDIRLLAAGGQTLAGEAVASALVSAPLAVTLDAGDDIDLPATALVESALSVLIQGDAQAGDGDPSTGTTIDIRGDVRAPTVEIAGGANLDFLQINTLAGINAAGVTTVRGHEGSDRIFIRALAGTTTLLGDDGADRFFLSSNASKALFSGGGFYDDRIDPLAANMPLSGNLAHLGGLVIDTGPGGNQGTVDAIYLSADDAAGPLVGSLETRSGQNVVAGLGMAGTIAYTAGTQAVLVIELGGYADTFHVKQVASNIVAYVDGAGGDDTLEAGNDAGLLTGIAGIFGFVGGAGHDTMNVHGSATGGGQLSAIGVTGMGMGTNQMVAVHNESFGARFNLNDPSYPAALYYGRRILLDGAETISTTVEAVNVLLGGGDDVFSVDGTAQGVASYVDGGGGDDAITVGATLTGLHPTRLRTVAGVGGALLLEGGAGSDTLKVDDSGNDTASVGTLAGTVVSGLGMGGSITFGSPDKLVIALGVGADRFYVPATTAGYTIDLLAGTGKDDIYLGTVQGAEHGGSLAGLQGVLHLDGQGPEAEDALYINDQGETAGQDFTISNVLEAPVTLDEGGTWRFDTTTVERSGMQAFDYRRFENVILNAGGGDDQVKLQATHREQATQGKNSTFTVNAGGGDDTINIGEPDGVGGYSLARFAIDLQAPTADSIRGIPVMVNGGAGYDVVHFKDTSATASTNLAFISKTFAQIFPSAANSQVAEPFWVNTFVDAFGDNPEFGSTGQRLYSTVVLAHAGQEEPLNVNARDSEHVKVSLGTGADVIQLFDGVYPNDITVYAGDGNDTFNIDDGVDNRRHVAILNGEDGDDLLFARFDQQVPNAQVFVEYNGGTHRTLGDTLRVAGNGLASGTYTPSSTVAHAGLVAVAGNQFNFTGVEPLVVHGLSDFRVLTPDDAAANLAIDSVNVADLNLTSLVLHAVTVEGVVSWTQQPALEPAGRSETKHSGQAVALSGNTMVVGADVDGSSSGVVFVYTWNGSAWVEQAKLYAGDRANGGGHGFGEAVGLDGDLLVVG
ncbi:MAG: repeat-containing protein, partial [Ramlibacter sp.]|nr:repeat-containing protein [Ramlibacter sp.]